MFQELHSYKHSKNKVITVEGNRILDFCEANCFNILSGSYGA
jgi:hypothetical protein